MVVNIIKLFIKLLWILLWQKELPFTSMFGKKLWEALSILRKKPLGTGYNELEYNENMSAEWGWFMILK